MKMKKFKEFIGRIVEVFCIILTKIGILSESAMADETRVNFSDVFEVIYSYSFEKDTTPSKSKLGNRESRWCRFCERETPVFRGDSHIIPAGLGNRSLFSLEECKDCNDPWGSDIEDHLAKSLFLTRAVSRIRTRKGSFKYKRAPSSTSNIASSPEKNLVYLEIDPADDSVGIKDIGDNRFLLSAKAQPYSPLKAAKALCRLGIFVLPKPDYDRCEHAVRWLRDEEEYNPYIIRVFNPGPGRKLVRLRVFRRKVDDESVAPFLVHLTYSSLDLFFPFPEASFEHPEVPIIPFPGFSPYPPHIPSAQRIDILSDGVVRDFEESLVLRYRELQGVGDLEAVEEHHAGIDRATTRELRISDFPESAVRSGIRGPVDLIISNRSGEILFNEKATIGIRAGDGDTVTSVLTGEITPWSLEVPLISTCGDFIRNLPAFEGRSIPNAAEMVFLGSALKHGTTIEARDRDDHAPILYMEYTPTEVSSADAKGLESDKVIFTRLMIIERAFPDRIRIPNQIGADDIREIEFISTAIDAGEFEDDRRQIYPVPMNRLSVDYISTEFSEGKSPEGIKATILGHRNLFGIDIDLGPGSIFLFRPRLVGDLDNLLEVLNATDPTDMHLVEMMADKCTYCFEKYLPRNPVT